MRVGVSFLIVAENQEVKRFDSLNNTNSVQQVLAPVIRIAKNAVRDTASGECYVNAVVRRDELFPEDTKGLILPRSCARIQAAETLANLSANILKRGRNMNCVVTVKPQTPQLERCTPKSKEYFTSHYGDNMINNVYLRSMSGEYLNAIQSKLSPTNQPSKTPTFDVTFKYGSTFNKLNLTKLNVVDASTQCTDAILDFFKIKLLGNSMERWTRFISMFRTNPRATSCMGIIVTLDLFSYAFSHSRIVSKWIVLDVNNQHATYVNTDPIYLNNLPSVLQYDKDWVFLGKRDKVLGPDEIPAGKQWKKKAIKKKTYAEAVSSGDEGEKPKTPRPQRILKTKTYEVKTIHDGQVSVIKGDKKNVNIKVDEEIEEFLNPTTQRAVNNVNSRNNENKRVNKTRRANVNKNEKRNRAQVVHMNDEQLEEVKKLAEAVNKFGKKPHQTSTCSCDFGFAGSLAFELKNCKIIRQGAEIPKGRYWFEIQGPKLPRIKLPWLAQYKTCGKFPAVADQLQSAIYLTKIFKPYLIDLNDLDCLKKKNFWFKQIRDKIYVYCYEDLAPRSWTSISEEEFSELNFNWVESNNNFDKAVSGARLLLETKLNREYSKELKVEVSESSSSESEQEMPPPMKHTPFDHIRTLMEHNRVKQESKYGTFGKEFFEEDGESDSEVELQSSLTSQRSSDSESEEEFKNESSEEMEDLSLGFTNVDLLEFYDDSDEELPAVLDYDAILRTEINDDDKFEMFMEERERKIEGKEEEDKLNALISSKIEDLCLEKYMSTLPIPVEPWLAKVCWSPEEMNRRYIKWLHWYERYEITPETLILPFSLEGMGRKQKKEMWLNRVVKTLSNLGYFDEHNFRFRDRKYFYTHNCWIRVKTLQVEPITAAWVPTEFEYWAATHPDSIVKNKPFYLAGKLAEKAAKYLMTSKKPEAVHQAHVIKHYLVNNSGERIRVKFCKKDLRKAEEDRRPVPLKFGDVVYEHESVIASFKTKDKRSTYNRIVDKLEFEGKKKIGNVSKPSKFSKMVLDFWDNVNNLSGHLLARKPKAETMMKIDYSKLLQIMCGQAVAPSLTPESRKAIIERNVTRMTQVNVDGLVNLDSTNQNLDTNTIYVANFISECALQSSELKQNLICMDLPADRKNSLRVGPGYY